MSSDPKALIVLPTRITICRKYRPYSPPPLRHGRLHSYDCLVNYDAMHSTLYGLDPESAKPLHLRCWVVAIDKRDTAHRSDEEYCSVIIIPFRPVYSICTYGDHSPQTSTAFPGVTGSGSCSRKLILSRNLTPGAREACWL